MTEGKNLLLIGSLPPFQSAAAALGLAAAEQLAKKHTLVFVIDDLAPPPSTDLPFKVIRLGDLSSAWDIYMSWPRLYVIGDDGDSLPALELLNKAPGVVIPASLSLMNLAIPGTRITANWPEDYWQWLAATAPDEAASLYSARVHFDRASQSLGREMPAFDLLLAKATHIVASSPVAAKALRSSGIAPALTLHLLPTAADADHAGTTAPRRVLYISESSAACQSIRRDLAVYDFAAGMEHTSIHPAARHLGAAIRDADVIVCLSGRDDACFPALATAMASGKPVITAAQPWAAHLPAGSHLSVPHDGALQTLAISIAALVTDPELRDGIGRAAQDFVKTADCGAQEAALVSLLSAPEGMPLPGHRSAPAGAPKTKPAIDVQPPKGPVALIGAVPPAAVLESLAPGVDLNRCPKFATPALANRVAEVAHQAAASLLGEMGYEAPLVAAYGNNEEAHRAAKPLSELQQGLLAPDALAFACTVDGAAQGDALFANLKARPALAIRIGFDEKDRKAPTKGYVTETGLFWDHDTVRGSVQCMVMVGSAGTRFTLQADGDTAYMVAGSGISCVIHDNQRAVLTSDELGLLEFRLMSLSGPTGAPLDSLTLRKQLAADGLILEWS